MPLIRVLITGYMATSIYLSDDLLTPLEANEIEINSYLETVVTPCMPFKFCLCIHAPLLANERDLLINSNAPLIQELS